MPVCTNRGCSQEYDSAENKGDSCTYHPGAPVFHEGLKSWSCCSDVNKSVLDFDEFMKIPGCTNGPHSDAAPKTDAAKPSTGANLKLTETQAGGKETYSTTLAPQQIALSSIASAPAAPEPEEEDDLSASVAPGTKCKRNGCKTLYESDGANRKGDRPEATCTYHPKAPIFHEGSKGYLCCKRRVLEFDEFLKIEGCKTGRHLFVPKNKETSAEQFTECRIDHYQTPADVHVSVFAKQADKERSTVKIEENAIHLDLYLPASKRFKKSIELFGPVDPSASSFKYYGTKVELDLRKTDARSWPVLEKSVRDLGKVNITFGVGGRTGTIGAKSIILDDQNKIKAASPPPGA
ncbi:chord-domain-containing protein [Fomitopsis serialis]|uniref:chord-domain-containing protein n=1 Tax=Fomitopsis serialis TaxID=139415 RepID=UPI0020076B76|nr:chord-domain-containing protein [Neoantrodia serialis]KAH9934685.1 chord-domain-containing protein [Neoantrodia serialis]